MYGIGNDFVVVDVCMVLLVLDVMIICVMVDWCIGIGFD